MQMFRASMQKQQFIYMYIHIFFLQKCSTTSVLCSLWFGYWKITSSILFLSHATFLFNTQGHNWGLNDKALLFSVLNAEISQLSIHIIFLILFEFFLLLGRGLFIIPAHWFLLNACKCDPGAPFARWRKIWHETVKAGRKFALVYMGNPTQKITMYCIAVCTIKVFSQKEHKRPFPHQKILVFFLAEKQIGSVYFNTMENKRSISKQTANTTCSNVIMKYYCYRVKCLGHLMD